MNSETEIWKNAVSSRFQDAVLDLAVSNLGNIKKIATGKIYKPHPKDGYLSIKRNFNGVTKTIAVHHLVIETFIGKRPPSLVIDHIDGNKLNNKANNLEYKTNVENSRKGNIKKISNEIAEDKDEVVSAAAALSSGSINHSAVAMATVPTTVISESSSIHSSNVLLASLLRDGIITEDTFNKQWSK
jgi:hypothetical protein